jgi:beta-1,4-mannosyl-glycoprotein beta-1,4-N-acetylglucosaminyltransferase
MPKKIDCFLFFQELDLLEIRLRYLYDVVDHFVIIEAGQAFSGKAKPFYFEQHAARFAPFADKIVYFKLDEHHKSFEGVINTLSGRGDPVSHKLLNIMEADSHVDRNELHWVLEEYHRECLFYPLTRVAEPGDLILFSDLDEIPTRNAIQRAESAVAPGQAVSFLCAEFDYFVNWFKFDGWLGPSASLWQDVQAYSLNGLRQRIRSGEDGARIERIERIERAGYHFTSCGGLAAVQRKIESWGHQEFNIGLVKSRLQTNIRYGRDVFFRGGSTLQYVNVKDSQYFDAKLQAIFLDYPELIAAEPEKETILSALHYRLDQAHFKMLRLSQKIKSAARAVSRRMDTQQKQAKERKH